MREKLVLAISKIALICFLLTAFVDSIFAMKLESIKLKTGDIIFRKEDSFLSDRFEKLDGRGYSHTGVIYIIDKKIYVLHIERDDSKKDLKIVPIKQYLKYATRYKIERLIRRYSAESINKNIQKIIKINPKFDFKFDLNSDDKMYCTELVFKLYKNSFGIELTKERHKFGFYQYISVGSLLDSKYLKNIATNKH